MSGVNDVVPAYRLNQDDLENYLRDKFPEHASFDVKLELDHYHFSVPRLLYRLTDRFIDSCNRADEFPKNLLRHEAFIDYNLTDYHDRLNDRADELFSSEDKGYLRFWEYDDEKQKFREDEPTGAEELTSLLRGASYFDRQDPRCRFIFVLAEHSRAPLDTSRNMLLYTLTYHQVMPAFLDFIFPFGKQIYTRDFFFSGFRHENRLAVSDHGPNLPRLGRSGLDIRVCYSLKSVEKSDEPEEKHASWSVRQTATYHSFDVETGAALWISVKGNDLIQDRVMTATENLGPEQRPFGTKERAFEESLSTHLINCKWAGEQWRWYLNDLEEELQGGLGRRALSARVVRDRRPEDKETLEFLRARSMSTKATTNGRPNPAFLLQPPHPRAKQTRSPSRESRVEQDSQDQFSFNDLRDVQSLEDKTNEVIFVLNANIDVLGELKEHYHDLVTSNEHAKYFTGNHNRSTERFEKQITSIINDLRMQITRAGALVRMLADRKALLYGILDYRNAAASMTLANKSQESANNMETMTRNMEKLTREMNELAQKTTQETVSMRIITLVTLFFLPGTFISTVMSTDIVKFQGPDGGPGSEVFRSDALKLYIYISIPLMVLTFAAWGIIYKLENWKAEKKKRKATGKEASEEV